jgi:hypothetical protein
LVLSLPLSNASAVTIDLRPDGPTTIAVGETVNVDVYMLLDQADQAAGVSAATLHLELGSAYVSVVASGAGSVFPTAAVNPVPLQDFIAFSEFGTTVTSPEAMLGTVAITGVNLGSYDLVARRFASFPLFTAPGVTDNRYDFGSNEALLIEVVPEAGTLVLLGASLAGLAFLRRRSV